MIAVTNKEGLTFEEWVCAAGVAIFESHECVTDTNKYPEEIKESWLNGEDPSEHRAEV